MLQTVSKSCPGASGQLGPKLPETKKEGGVQTKKARTPQSHFSTSADSSMSTSDTRLQSFS